MSKKRFVEAAKLAAKDQASMPSSVEQLRAEEERIVHTEEMHVSLGDQLEAAHPAEAAAIEELKEALPEGEPIAEATVYQEALHEIEVAEASHVEPLEARSIKTPPSSRARERHLHEKRQPHVEGAERAAAAVHARKKMGRIRRVRTTSKLAVREIKKGMRNAVHELYLGVRRAAETLTT